MLIWKETHSIGNEELDEQHKFFFDIVNILDECNNCEDAILNINKLKLTLREHSKLEEKYMSEIKFPKLNSHKELHNEIEEEISESFNRFIYAKDRKNILKEIVNKIKDHIINHLLAEDIEIKIWFDNNRG